MINTDAGSTDGTPDLIRDASFTKGDVVQTSHSLRTVHRVNAPYHGLPGKLTALRTLFAATALTQAKTLVMIDPGGPAASRDQVTDLIAPIMRGEIEFLAPRHRRHPRDGALVTQLVRPLVRAVYRVGLDEPLGAEFGCSGRFASHCLDRDIWQQDAASFAIDLWLRTEAVANQFALGQIWRAAPGTATTTTLRQAIRQIFKSLVVILRAHEAFWSGATESVALRTWGQDPTNVPEVTNWEYVALGEQARRDITEIRPLLEEVLEPPVLARLLSEDTGGDPQHDDELWVRIVCAFLVATNRGRSAIDQLADMFVPVYLWRASAFMSRTASDTINVAQSRLDALCDTFQRLRPTLTSEWSTGQ